MKSNKSIIATILLVFVLALTAACGKAETSSSKPSNQKQENAASKEEETTAELEAYVVWYDDHMNALEDEATTYNDLMGNSVVGNKKWEAKVEKSLKRAQKLVDEGDDKEDVPKSFKKAHKHVLRAGTEFQYIIDNTPAMLSSYDIDLMEDVSISHDNVTFEIENADQEVDKVVYAKHLSGSKQ
ncbi:hypothetical protein ACL9ST_11560 [Bacillus australimaris]|uniref:hypothetical protein n=1 Tax=Bacillus australimaris TaxID=1326968 RepID=UPI0039B3E454